MTINDAMYMFTRAQRAKGNSAVTVRDYVVKLRFACDYFGCASDVKTLDLPGCRSYVEFLMSYLDNSITVQSYVRSFRAFLHWLYLNEYIDLDLCSRFVLPKARKPLINILSDDEIESLLSVYSSDDFISFRNRVILSLMFDAGLRLSEVIYITPADVNLRERVILINGKGNKQRFVSFGDCTARLLALYSLRREDLPSYFYKKDKSPLTVSAMKNLFRKLKAKSGVDRVYAHLLRHTFATRFLLNGGDVYVLKEWLGHSSLKQTQGYIHLAKALSVSKYSACTPLDRINKEPP